MNLYIIPIESKDKGGRKLVIHAETEKQARDMVYRRYDLDHWTIQGVHLRTGPIAITFEENWWE